MIVLDASVIIGFLDSTDAHHEPAVALLRRHADEDLGASVITVAETLVGPTRANRLGAAVDALDALQIRTIGLPSDAAVQLAQLHVQTGLRMPDCCVVLAAREHTVATFDERLASASRAVGIRVSD